MKMLFCKKSNYGGVYKITNLINGRIYIGSTYSFYKRAYNHLNSLEANRHKNAFLQNDYNKCGKHAFLFEVVEVISEDQLVRLNKEQFFIDRHYDGQKQCYNLSRLVTNSRSGTCNRNITNPITDKRCRPPSMEVLLKRGKRIKEAKSTSEQKEKARMNALNGLWKNHNANIRVRNIITKEEVVIQGSIRQWCLERNLSYKAFHLMITKKTKSSQGWVV